MTVPIVIIGAGIGGLSTAIRLAAAGRRVVLFEQNDTVGGKMGEVAEAGFRWDTGPSVITMRHEARKLNQAVTFITSPGYLRGGDAREKLGLRGGPSRVITDKAIFGFDPQSKRMRLESIHPNTTLEDVLSNMSFEPIVPDEVPVTVPPTAEEVRLIREEIDPEKAYA